MDALSDFALLSGIDISILREKVTAQAEEAKLQIPPTPTKCRPHSPVSSPSPKKIAIEPNPILASIKPRLRVRRPKRISACQVNTKTDYRDRALSVIDVDKYHDNILNNGDIQSLVALSKKIQRSQLDRFTFDSRQYFVAIWLTVLRVFEYIPGKNCYFEAKRIPSRYIDIESNLITSIHFCDSKLYIAYLSNELGATAYVEIRDLSSKLLQKPRHYDNTIVSIESDKTFIYIRTINNVMHIHNQKYFNLNHYAVDLKIIQSPLVTLRAAIQYTHPYTKLELCVAAENCFIVSEYDAFNYHMKQVYNLDSRYRTVSAHFMDGTVIMHRNIIGLNHECDPKSKLKVGLLVTNEQQRYFVFERCLSFSYDIIQTEIFQDKIILYGCNAGNFELACLSANEFKPIWSIHLTDVDRDCKFIAQDDRIIVFRGDQQHLIFNMMNHETIGGIFKGMKTELNKSIGLPIKNEPVDDWC